MAEILEERIQADAKFASNVSHELRSPLTTIMASVEILNSSSDSLDDSSQLALDLLNADLERFTQLVEDLLEISRYDVGVNALTLRFLQLNFGTSYRAKEWRKFKIDFQLDLKMSGLEACEASKSLK